MVAYVADLPIEVYNSDTRRLEPKVPWMERNDRLYWLWKSEVLQWKESALTAEVKSMMGRMNHTEGLHTLQKIYGCELGEDGSSTWVYRDAYDGVTLLSLYGDTVVYKADIHPATVILDRWMHEELQIQQVKGYLEQRCLTDLQRYLKAGAEHLQRGFLEVPPRNRRCRMKHGVRTFLLGEVFGFYPREMEVRWFRGGVEIPTDFMEILPNPDGTFQVRTMVEVHEGDEETYKYQVDHSSLPEPVRVECEARSSSISKIGVSIGGIAGGLVLVLLLLAVICVWMCWNKCAGESCFENGCLLIEGNRNIPPVGLSAYTCNRSKAALGGAILPRHDLREKSSAAVLEPITAVCLIG